MNAVLRSALAEVALGTHMQGGLFAGAYAIGDKPYGLIVSPKALGDLEPQTWIARNKDVPGAKSFVDGLANTQAMAEAGSKLAQKAIGTEIDGHKDWYIGAVDELELAYRAFKPTKEENSKFGRSGINVSAIPPTLPYSHVLVLQSELPEFRQGGAEAFKPTWYWTSTQHASDSNYAWGQSFGSGFQDDWIKDNDGRARLVRRFAL